MKTNIKLKSGFKFLPEHLRTHLKVVNRELYPHIYGDKTPGNMKYLRTEIVPISDIDPNNEYFSQLVRSGINPKYPEIKHDIDENGFSLSELPMQVMESPDDIKLPLYMLEGRTRFDILTSIGVTHVIVDVYEQNTPENYIKFSFEQNNNKKPSGASTYDDAMLYIKSLVKVGGIDITKTQSNIIKQIKDLLKCMGKRITSKQMNLIINEVTHETTGNRLFRSFKNGEEVKEWLNKNGYRNTKKIKYMPIGSNMEKLIPALMRHSNDPKNENCELRFITYSTSLNARKPESDWIDRNLNLKKRFDTFRKQISNFFFNNAKLKEPKAYLYGTVPQAHNLSETYPLDKVVVYDN